MSSDLTHEAMSRMAKMAFESATQSLATKAREFSRNLPPQVSGKQALEAFADAIEKTNEKRFGDYDE